MTKPLVIAALLAVSHAQEVCVDANTLRADAAVAAADAKEKADKAAMINIDKDLASTKALAKVDADALAKFVAAGAPVIAANALAIKNAAGYQKLSAAADVEIGKNKAPLVALKKTLDEATKAVADQKKLVVAQDALIVTLTKQESVHKTQKTTLNKAHVDAKKISDASVAATPLAKKVLADAKTAKGDGTSAGTQKNAADYLKDAGTYGKAKLATKAGIVTYGKTWKTYEVKKLVWFVATDLAVQQAIACGGACATGDKIFKADGDAKKAVTAAKDDVNTGGKAELALWVKDRDAQVLLRDTEANEKAKYDALVALDKVQDGIIAGQPAKVAAAEKKEKEDLALTATALKSSNRADKEWTQADLHLKRAKAELVLLKAPQMGFDNAVVYATDAYNKLVKSNAVQVALKAAQVTPLKNTAAISLLAKAGADKINKKTAYYTAIGAKTIKAQAASQAIKDANAAAQKANTANLAAAKKAQAAALQQCKLDGWAAAQATRKAKDDGDLKTADARTAYKKAITAPVDGTAGTRCELPKIAAGVQAARPACTGATCCGQAWKINRDGSVSRIESCQAAAAMTYTYKAPWLATDPAQPAAQTWPFVCLFKAEAMKDNKLATPFPLPGYDLKPKPAAQ